MSTDAWFSAGVSIPGLPVTSAPAGDTAVSGTTPATVGGLSADLNPGTYTVAGQVILTAPSGSPAVVVALAFTGTASASGVWWTESNAAGASVPVTTGNGTLATVPGGLTTIGVAAATDSGDFSGTVTVSAAGTLTVTVALTAAGGSVTVAAAGSWLSVTELPAPAATAAEGAGS